MMSHRMRAFGAASIVIVLSGCGARRAEFPVQHYVPKTREMLPLGSLQLSNTQLQLTGLEGQMKLEYVGIMPESAGADMAGASVFRVKNAESFFKKNVGRNAFCSETPLWVAVNSRTGAPAWSSEIWLGLLTLKEWAKFTHAVDRVCAGGDYVRTGS